jgi:hypothetical protein
MTDLKFQSNTKRKTYNEFVRSKEIAQLCHQIEMNCYHGSKGKVEAFRASLEAICLQSDVGKDQEYNTYLEKGY